MSDIQLTVLEDMRLFIEPEEIARDAENNSALFTIQQPPSLDQYVCRAEVTTTEGTTYRLVTDHSFLLTNDISVAGAGYLQLVYSDGDAILRKTKVAQFHVAVSLNAVDPSDPEFQDGLGQLQQAAFAQAQLDDTTLIFSNISGQEVDRVTLPGAAEDLDTLYLRLNGFNRMAGNLQFAAANLGIVLDALGSAPVLYSDGLSMRLRKAQGNPDITIEDNSGIAATRSPVVTVQTGDQRWLGMAAADLRYVNRNGDVLGGPLNTAYDSTTDPPSALATRQYVLDHAGISFEDADNRYLIRDTTAAQQLRGMLITTYGSGNTPALALGTNDTGFWRTGANVVFEVGYTPIWIANALGVTSYVPILLPIAPPTQNQHATNKAYVDATAAAGGLAATQLHTLVGHLQLTTNFQNVIAPQQYSIPRGGNSRVMVSVMGGLRFPGQASLGMIQLRVGPGEIVRNVFCYSVPEGANVETNSFTLTFFVDVAGTAPFINVEARSMAGTNPDLLLLGGAAEPQRTQIVFQDVGPR